MGTLSWKSGLAILCLLGMVAFAAFALDDDDPCRQACQDEQSRCVTVCGDHPNPVECEADCREASEDCEDRCE